VFQNALNVIFTAERDTIFLLLVNLLSQTFKHLVSRFVVIAHFLAQFGESCPNTGWLVDADLFSHSQVHGQVQKGIALARLYREVSGKNRFWFSVKHFKILGMLGHPLQGKAFCFAQWLFFVVFFQLFKKNSLAWSRVGLNMKRLPRVLHLWAIEQAQTESIVSGWCYHGVTLV